MILSMTVKFPYNYPLRFSKRYKDTYLAMLKSAKENPKNPYDSLNEEIMIACEFYLENKDKIGKEETKQ